VAASRRSDRSLEARVESARRASEIHKRRTGRGFKITIEGVEKEEMYEEEDDLPSQYRHVSSHLYNGAYSSGGPAFNDRVLNFLATNMEMRKMVANSMQAQDGQNNSHQFTNTNMGIPTPMPMPLPQSQYMAPPQQAHSAVMYRQAPYPTPRPPPQQAFHQSHHQRSASFATPAGQPAAVQHSPMVHAMDHRRMSMPAAIPSADGSPLQMNTPKSAPSVQSTPPQRPPAMSSRQPSSYGYVPQVLQPQQQQSMPAYDMNTLPNDYFPFTAQLPANAQGLLGSTLDPNDPLTHMMMAGSGNLPTSFYNFGPQPQAPTSMSTGGQQTHPTLDGLGSTLAPSAFDMLAGADQSQPSFFSDAFTAESSGHATPAVTPGDNVQWGQFMNNDWDDLQSSQTSQQ
jgi:hypothetical protein